ncbi:MAG: hypothetical protein WAL26_16220 [Mycobacterium sp.]
MARKYATADAVGLPELLEFVRPRHRMVLATFRGDGGKCLIRITPHRWGPVATGGFPPP